MAADTGPINEVSENPHRIVVSGVTGLVGRELTARLVACGADVVGLTRQKLSNIPPFLWPVTLDRLGDGTASLVDLFHQIRPDTVIHLAALRG